MNMSKYVILKKYLTGKQQFVKPEDVMDIVDTKHEWYQSTFQYNEEHKALFEKQGHIRGVTDVKTDKLYFDFDDESNPENAKNSAKEVIKKLKQEKIKEKNIEVYFSSNKGFHVIVTLKTPLNPAQLRSIAFKLSGDLPGFDISMYDAAQILRVPFTKNHKSNLYKIPLTLKQLELPIEKIKEMAKDINAIDTEQFQWEPEQLDEKLMIVEEPKIKEVKQVDINLSDKPRHWLDYKWALLNAVEVKENERHEALMRIAATCRSLGYPEDMARALCLTFDDKFTANTKKPPVEDLDDNILATVYSSRWEGGNYSIKTDKWLQEYAKRVGLESLQEEDNKTLDIGNVFEEFEQFSQDFEKNILKTGIKELDENSLFLTSTHNGILGQPGSGKTSFLIQWLEYLSSQNQHSFFYSLDMAESIIGAKLVQRVTGLSFKDATKLALMDKENYNKVKEDIKEKFKNVNFNFTSGTKVEDIKETILAYEKNTGNKVRFLCIDYLECLQGPYSDSTANTGFISQQLKDLARELKVCSVILLQTQKSTGGGDVSEPILSMKKIKGSSIIEQSASLLLTLWREGYSPKFQQYDKYMSFAVVKNRFGPLWTDDFSWSGVKGNIRGILTDEERYALDDLRQAKIAEKTAANEENSGWS